MEPSPIAPRAARFGAFEVDLANAELRKHGLQIHIQGQPFQILAALLERPGEVVTRDQLVQRLWPDGTYVDFDRGLNTAVTRLRQILSDSAETPRYVETLARRGYRFIMPVEIADQLNHEPVPKTPVKPPEANRPVGPWQAVWAGRHIALLAGVLAILVLAVGLMTWPNRSASKETSRYTQITDFADSAISPALSPDGHSVVFLRSTRWFLSSDEIWLKRLPDGEAIQLTRDPRQKFGPAFSPDGMLVGYSVVDNAATTWDTVVVPAAGGEPRPLMQNAEGLTWIDKRRLLFSEIRTGLHMAVVTANENRSEGRDVYVPQHERAMAHFSSASPDRKWVLVIEMDHTIAWQPCRLVPFDGSSRGRQVGPPGKCTAVGWSPDGKWMYFTVSTREGQHLWRQRFPQGPPEQLTFGPTEEQGVAVAPDSRSLITSIGMQQSSIWLHDEKGDRAISSVGHAAAPMFSADGKRIFYLLRRGAPDSPNELWAADLLTGRSDLLVSGFEITSYDVAESGTEVVFAAKSEREVSQIWLASPRRRSSPVLVASGGVDAPFFGPGGTILFRLSDGKANYLYRMNSDGSGRALVVPHPISNVMSVSPDRLWAATLAPVNDSLANVAEMAIPIQGGTPRRICSGFCVVRWAPDGKFLYVTLDAAGTTGESKTVAIPVPATGAMPELPVSGLRSLAEARALSRDPVISQFPMAPGMRPSVYAYVKTVMHRNLFRITLP